MTDPSAQPWSDPTAPVDPAAPGYPGYPPPSPFVSPDTAYTPPGTYPGPAAPAYPPYVDPAPAPPYGAYPASAPPAYPAPGTYPPAAGSYGGYGGYVAPAPVGYPYPTAAPSSTNGLAIASMVVSLVGLALTFCYGIGAIGGLVGAILGHIARRQIRTRAQNGGGMALAGIIVGWIAVAIGAAFIALIVFAFAGGFGDLGSSSPTFELLRG